MRNRNHKVTPWRGQARSQGHTSKKKTISLIVACFLLFVAVIGCAKREIKNVNSRGRNIICFGDSITFGYGVSPGQDYPSALAQIINTPIINAGIDGETTPEALQRIKQDVLDKDPLLVIIEFAGNDFLKKLPMEETVNNIKEMIEQIQSRGAMVAIVDISAGMFFSEYRKAFKNLAQEKQAIFIPHILSGIITTPSMKSDFLHPNADGYKIVAQRIHSSIAPFLEQNKATKK